MSSDGYGLHESVAQEKRSFRSRIEHQKRDEGIQNPFMMAPHTAERCSSPKSNWKHRPTQPPNGERAEGDGSSDSLSCVCCPPGTRPATGHEGWCGSRVSMKTFSQTWNLRLTLCHTSHSPQR